MDTSRSITRALSERSCRNTCGYVLFAFATIVPSVAYWQNGGDNNRQPNVAGQQRPFDRPQFRPGPPGPRNATVNVWAWLWWCARAAFAAAGTTIAMLVLLPYRGCKRFALLFGTPTGLAAMITSSFWLAGRNEVYRFEPALAAIIGAAPTGFLWIQFCKWSFEVHRDSAQEPFVIKDDDLID